MVFASGPGDWMMQREKMPSTTSTRYWPSYMVHLWACNALRVSRGENEVESRVMEEEGDVLERSLDLMRRRRREGKGSRS